MAVFGPQMWYVIHYTCKHYTDATTQAQRQLRAAQLNVFLSHLRVLLPCPVCRDHLNKKNWIDYASYAKNGQMFMWSFCLHNKVNEMLDRTYSFRVVKDLYDDLASFEANFKSVMMSIAADVLQRHDYATMASVFNNFLLACVALTRDKDMYDFLRRQTPTSNTVVWCKTVLNILYGSNTPTTINVKQTVDDHKLDCSTCKTMKDYRSNNHVFIT